MSRRLVVEADGGSRGNPGPAGYGALVRDADSGEVLAERAAPLGRTTNNVAEYNGLLAGLAAAATLDPAAVLVRMDSKLVIEQMSGRWKVRHPDLQPLHAEGRRLAAALPSVKYEWIPRERNSYADRLANEAMDAAAAGRTWSSKLPEPGAATATVPNADEGWLADDDSPTRTVLVRHGRTELSGLRYSGRGNPSLDEGGLAQAAALARRLSDLKGATVVSSPLARTVATATAIADALGVAVSTDDGLLETDFGAWEGRTFAEVKQHWKAERKAWRSDTSVAPPGGESVNQVARRVRQARDRIIAANPGGTVVVVSHVTPIKLLLCSALNAPSSSVFRMHLDTASVSTVDWFPDRVPLVRLFNDTAHLTD